VGQPDIVLRGGRVVDPGSGLDAIRHVAVTRARVAEISDKVPPGSVDIDVSGLVVTAGFVDLHSHVNDIAGLRLQAMDGVTTALELEAGASPVNRAYRNAAAQGRPVNYGFAASWAQARMRAVGGIEPGASLAAFLASLADPRWQRPAQPGQSRAMLDALSADLADGALNIGVLLGYAPAASPGEYLAVAALAAQAGVPTFTHARDLVELVPETLIDGAEEIVRAAGQTGAHMHYCHVTWTEPPPDRQVWPLPGTAITHPRTAGTFARALRMLTRGEETLGLSEVLSKCSLEPARLLEAHVPAMRHKGRLGPGSDADVVVFDPSTIADRADHGHSTHPSAGIRHVLVSGTFVVRDGQLVIGAAPGRPVRAEAGSETADHRAR
jgi:cytosine/adenosine deaminase-related metal-dependent hydrolase